MAAVAKALHSSGEESWGTPLPIIDLARNILGQIDLDPFSSAEWNKSLGAKRFISEEENGFASSWGREGALLTAMVNPPGDRRGENAKRAWRLTRDRHDDGTIGGGAVFICFSLNQLQTLQGIGRSPLDPLYLRLIPRRRLDYQRAPGVSGGAPPHPSEIVLLPSRVDRAWQAYQFSRLGAEIGEVF